MSPLDSLRHVSQRREPREDYEAIVALPKGSDGVTPSLFGFGLANQLTLSL